MSDIGPLLPFVLIILFFYLVLIRPQKARQREAMRLQDQISPGQEVMTTAGLYGTVVAIEDDAVILQISPGVTSKWARAAIARIVEPLEPADTNDAVELRKDSRGGAEGGSSAQA